MTHQTFKDPYSNSTFVIVCYSLTLRQNQTKTNKQRKKNRINRLEPPLQILICITVPRHLARSIINLDDDISLIAVNGVCQLARNNCVAMCSDHISHDFEWFKN